MQTVHYESLFALHTLIVAATKTSRRAWYERDVSITIPLVSRRGWKLLYDCPLILMLTLIVELQRSGRVDGRVSIIHSLWTRIRHITDTTVSAPLNMDTCTEEWLLTVCWHRLGDRGAKELRDSLRHRATYSWATEERLFKTGRSLKRFGYQYYRKSVLGEFDY